MARRPQVALVALPPDAARSAADHFRRRGHDTHLVEEHWETESLLEAGGVDLVVLAMHGSGNEALDLLRKYGGTGKPAFLMLTQASHTLERVLALELGAADIAELGISARELAARVGGILSRTGAYTPDLLLLENAAVDLRAALVMHHSGREEQLSPGQLAMLRLFISRPRVVLTRDEVLAVAPAEALEAFDRSIDSRIVRLRRKLDTECIVAVRGAGYRFDPPQGLQVGDPEAEPTGSGSSSRP